ncbi:hypothetical protein [Bradyrhizobium sp. NAS80.1]|uniref:hypothetical protein n=1 Tax=Bradyrhizobium sp. NAS80.1 TaxID=1680159 RepID=UPI001FD9E53B|nr:hypothetical protein [Bradyrhizobium sp. NAS80.1]
MLRLIKAFEKITDLDFRRMVVLNVEEQLAKQEANERQGKRNERHTGALGEASHSDS